jgi:lipopolysaccharide/colanic/teichoic acid biosynthesis glycosyltransferase
MQVKNLSKDRPLKRNDSLSHERRLTVSIGGTGAISFGDSLRYLINRIKLDLSRRHRNTSAALDYFLIDKLFSNILLMAFFAKSIALPQGFSLDLPVSRYWRNFCYLIKVSVDFLGALVGLILLIPLFLIVAILIKLDSPGPVFYTQLRVGRNRRRNDRRQADCRVSADRRNRDRRRENAHGKPFDVIKFRTMVDKAEKKCGPIWATKNDPRITRVGAFLRKTRVDEFPQLINVLKGDMSLIGPRPERPVFVSELSTKVDRYTERLQVKPGITGLAQVENGYDSSIDSVKNKVALDLSYINRWSLWQDFKIILKTISVVITGKGAF